MASPLHIGIVAGEPSGDRLAAGLIAALRAHFPDSRYTGMVGPEMQRARCEPWFHIKDLSVMGVTDVLRRYHRLSRLRRDIIARYRHEPPNIFIGVDVPDFVLPIERTLRQGGIPTAHLVSPTVWAWRPGRVKQVAQAADLLLTIFPFEAEYYVAEHLRVVYVGHPYADEIPLVGQRAQARSALGLDPAKEYLACLPGSRDHELAHHSESFLKVLCECKRRRPEIEILCAPVHAEAELFIAQQALRHVPRLPITYYTGQARMVLMVSNVALVASGTATLEAMLCKCPQVVAYRTSWLNFRLLKPFMKIDRIAMVNILAGKPLVPEFLQDQVQVSALADALLAWLRPGPAVELYLETCLNLHRRLRRDAEASAAAAIADLVRGV